jgi:excisionase family DNA binding protein
MPSKRSHTPSRGVAAARTASDGREAANGSCQATVLLTAEQLAARWQVRPQHVYTLARDGNLPHLRIGRYVRFRLEAIEAWEQDNEARF